MNNGNKFTAEELESIWKEMLAKDDRKPKLIDRSAWEPCEKCRSCRSCAHVVESMNDSTGACFWCDHMNQFKPMNFCSACGRPLTDAAWDVLEKRLEKL